VHCTCEDPECPAEGHVATDPGEHLRMGRGRRPNFCRACDQWANCRVMQESRKKQRVRDEAAAADPRRVDGPYRFSAPVSVADEHRAHGLLKGRLVPELERLKKQEGDNTSSSLSVMVE
jgi:hypothetical protein